MGFSFKVAPGVRVSGKGVNVGGRYARAHLGYDGRVGVQHNIGVGPISHNGYHPLNGGYRPQVQKSSNAAVWIWCGLALFLTIAFVIFGLVVLSVALGASN